MDEPQLMRQLKELCDIKPRQDWVILAKNRILAEPTEALAKADKPGLLSFFPLFRYKLAFAPIISVLVVIGLFGFTQKTVPGDTLFSVKKMTETAQVAFTSNIEKPKTQLKLANKRLDELSRIAQANQVRSLDPAIKEFQTSMAQAVQDLVAMNTSVTSSDALILQEIAIETQKLEENKQKIETVLGVVIGDTGALENALAKLVERELKDLEERSLTEQQSQFFEEARLAYLEGDYLEALVKILLLSNQ